MQISITRALVELKRIDQRIMQAVANGQFVSRVIGQNTQQRNAISSESIEATTRKIRGAYQSIEALITNRQKLKSAIVLSNATTKVTILGADMSIAEAIELKGTIGFRSQYLTTLRKQLLAETTVIAKQNAELEVAIATSLNTIYSNDKGKVDAQMYALIANPQRAQKEASLLDPCSISDKILKVEKEIQDLTSEVDFTLSESNARTTIEVDLETS